MSNVVDLTEVSSGRPYIDLDDCVLRCIECEPKKSKAQNNMLILTWEFCSPETVPDQKTGKPVKIGGLKIVDFIVLADTGMPKLKALHKALSLSMKVDLDNMDTKVYVGKAINAKVRTEPVPLKENDEVVLDEETGNPVIMNNYRLRRIKSANEQYTIPAGSVAY